MKRSMTESDWDEYRERRALDDRERNRVNGRARSHRRPDGSEVLVPGMLLTVWWGEEIGEGVARCPAKRCVEWQPGWWRLAPAVRRAA